MNPSSWILLVNVFAATFEYIGRHLAGTNLNRIIATKTLPIIILIQSSFLIIYFGDFVQKYNWLSLIALVFVAFCFVRVSCSITYFFMEGNKKATSETQDACSVLTSNALLIGTGVGNLASNIFPVIYESVKSGGGSWGN